MILPPGRMFIALSLIGLPLCAAGFYSLRSASKVPEFPIRLSTLENLLIGAWTAVAVTNTAIFASSFPYIFSAEAEIRCGSIGISTVSMTMVRMSLIIVSVLYVWLRLTRWVCNMAIHGLRHRSQNRLLQLTLLATGLLFGVAWGIGFVVGATLFASVVDQAYLFMSNPPTAPSGVTDPRVCQGLANFFNPYDRVMDWVVHMVR